MIPAVAQATARRERSMAIVLFVVAGVLALTMVSPWLDPNHKWKHPDHKPVGGLVVALAVLVGGPAWLGARRVMATRRARSIGKRSAEASFTWYLSGDLVVAVDDRGVPQPDLSLKVTKTMRQTLAAVPSATLLK
jgi:peptidoglycan/LPS O-acetylase OafA/YrhL